MNDQTSIVSSVVLLVIRKTTVTFTPDEGYLLGEVNVNGEMVEVNANTYTITNTGTNTYTKILSASIFYLFKKLSQRIFYKS